jgi:hypothetical protein
MVRGSAGILDDVMVDIRLLHHDGRGSNTELVQSWISNLDVPKRYHAKL